VETHTLYIYIVHILSKQYLDNIYTLSKYCLGIV